MKFSYYLLTGALLFGAGCKKEGVETVPVPAAVPAPAPLAASFNQPFVLRYHQRADLPDQSAPELRLIIKDILDSRCPRIPTLSCGVAGFVQVVVEVRGLTGEPQEATLYQGTTLGDSAVVRTNNRRYVLKLQDVLPYPAAPDIASFDHRKEVLHVHLTVRR